jgi:hypothetical protein
MPAHLHTTPKGASCICVFDMGPSIRAFDATTHTTVVQPPVPHTGHPLPRMDGAAHHRGRLMPCFPSSLFFFVRESSNPTIPNHNLGNLQMLGQARDLAPHVHTSSNLNIAYPRQILRPAAIYFFFGRWAGFQNCSARATESSCSPP